MIERVVDADIRQPSNEDLKLYILEHYYLL